MQSAISRMKTGECRVRLLYTCIDMSEKMELQSYLHIVIQDELS